MSKLFIGFMVIYLNTTLSLAQDLPRCPELGLAANSIAKINGATLAVPSFRLIAVPIMTQDGAEFNYQYDAKLEIEDSSTVTVGTIITKALIKPGESQCKILSVSYSECPKN